MTFAAPEAVRTGSEEDLRQFLSDIRQYPLLSPGDEYALALRCVEGDREAIRRMVNCNLRLVLSVAREYAGRGVPLLDLIQEGSIGLLAAAEKFDPTLNFRFSTYATKWIRRGVLRHLTDQTSVIRVPAHTADKLRKVVAARNALAQELGQQPEAEQIARRCDMTVPQVEKLLELIPQVWSLDAPVGEDASLGEVLEDLQAPQPQEQLVREELTRLMNALLAQLDERQQLVLRLHFGMDDNRCHSLEEISREVGVSKERVRQIEHQALERLRKLGAEIGLEDFLYE